MTQQIYTVTGINAYTKWDKIFWRVLSLRSTYLMSWHRNIDIISMFVLYVCECLGWYLMQDRDCNIVLVSSIFKYLWWIILLSEFSLHCCYSNCVIKSQFQICHDSSTVVTCSNPCPVMIFYNFTWPNDDPIHWRKQCQTTATCYHLNQWWLQ